MSDATRRLLEAAMELPEGERAEFAAQLIASLDPETDEDWAAAWDEEIRRRIEELDSGRVKTIPWEEARRRIAGEK